MNRKNSPQPFKRRGEFSKTSVPSVILLFTCLLCRFYYMPYQHGGSYASNAARYGSDGIYDWLYFCIVYVTAEFSFFIYIDTYVNNNLSRPYIRIVNYSARPAATITISASFTTDGISTVLVWHTVTVAFFLISIMAAGFPTTRERPTTTAFFPVQSIP